MLSADIIFKGYIYMYANSTIALICGCSGLPTNFWSPIPWQLRMYFGFNQTSSFWREICLKRLKMQTTSTTQTTDQLVYTVSSPRAVGSGELKGLQSFMTLWCGQRNKTKHSFFLMFWLHVFFRTKLHFENIQHHVCLWKCNVTLHGK